MDNRSRPFEEGQTNNVKQSATENGINPFENNQPVEKDIAQSQEELEKEQQFKEALTERD
jgi:hypothetical protein